MRHVRLMELQRELGYTFRNTRNLTDALRTLGERPDDPRFSRSGSAVLLNVASSVLTMMRTAAARPGTSSQSWSHSHSYAGPPTPSPIAVLRSPDFELNQSISEAILSASVFRKPIARRNIDPMQIKLAAGTIIGAAFIDSDGNLHSMYNIIHALGLEKSLEPSPEPTPVKSQNHDGAGQSSSLTESDGLRAPAAEGQESTGQDVDLTSDPVSTTPAFGVIDHDLNAHESASTDTTTQQSIMTHEGQPSAVSYFDWDQEAWEASGGIAIRLSLGAKHGYVTITGGPRRPKIQNSDLISTSRLPTLIHELDWQADFSIIPSLPDEGLPPLDREYNPDRTEDWEVDPRWLPADFLRNVDSAKAQAFLLEQKVTALSQQKQIPKGEGYIGTLTTQLLHQVAWYLAYANPQLHPYLRRHLRTEHRYHIPFYPPLINEYLFNTIPGPHDIRQLSHVEMAQIDELARYLVRFSLSKEPVLPELAQVLVRSPEEKPNVGVSAKELELVAQLAEDWKELETPRAPPLRTYEPREWVKVSGIPVHAARDQILANWDPAGVETRQEAINESADVATDAPFETSPDVIPETTLEAALDAIPETISKPDPKTTLEMTGQSAKAISSTSPQSQPRKPWPKFRPARLSENKPGPKDDLATLEELDDTTSPQPRAKQLSNTFFTPRGFSKTGKMLNTPKGKMAEAVNQQPKLRGPVSQYPFFKPGASHKPGRNPKAPQEKVEVKPRVKPLRPQHTFFGAKGPFGKGKGP
ncbi:uncharacterized protein BO95DRAFT_146643 [Aspergillus brunneoviolaceus CBS 621.78]|uniref:Uncharacterized protein n=1 Tax=Aspergillus brunneoviolaceus CBS 621.78 TaxID=1450534 RepID=A0ACD1G823_9EURO|nr:hypothetical protein BO95DRAFT_146643 [Aspergillus brunneoviolaceus CBS 621.78]RAH45322.1 hypothetical protein BO95DRAFT_146643 [Aspergillus brunneoviolaceus CBS 621.78]